MAQHARLRIDTGLQVFRDPQSLAARHQREHQRLLRQYFPKAPTSRATAPATSPRSPTP